MAMAGSILQLVIEKGVPVEVELNTRYDTRDVDPSLAPVWDMYEKIHGPAHEMRPALAAKLVLSKTGTLCLSIGARDLGQLPRTVAGFLDAVDEVLFFDVDFISGIATAAVEATIAEFTAEIGEKLDFYEKGRKLLKERELVILPHGIPGTQVTHTIYAMVVETYHDAPLKFERDAEEYDAKLCSLDPHGRLFFFYINSGRIVRATNAE